MTSTPRSELTIDPLPPERLVPPMTTASCVLLAVQMRATLDEATGKWKLDGVKRFITNGCADVHVVLARSEPGSTDARGLSLFVAERDETVHIRRLENKMGIHASPTCEVQYNGTPAVLLGKRRFGLLRYAMALMNGARLAVGAQALGIAEAAYREAYRYAQERCQFGQPIAELPAVNDQPINFAGGRFWLVNLDSTQPNDRMYQAEDEPNPIQGVAAIYKVCTHLGCIVQWAASENRFRCPCHAAEFTREGEVMSGPPPKALGRLETKIQDGALFARI